MSAILKKKKGVRFPTPFPKQYITTCKKAILATLQGESGISFCFNLQFFDTEFMHFSHWSLHLYFCESPVHEPFPPSPTSFVCLSTLIISELLFKLVEVYFLPVPVFPSSSPSE